MVQAAVTPLLHVTIEYEYARDGEIVSRTVNGKVQRYAYDRRGQLTGIYDANGQAVEAYTYDAAGNILKKTINGKTTTFTYDAANQLVSKQDDAGTTSYEYDAAGRMIREGDKEYRYSYLDKITSVIENGETAATMDYFVGGQLASVTRGHEIERFIWDGLALVHRDGSDYLNEPAVGGGNPIASGGQVMFNDMLGSTVAVKGDENYSLTSMTAFGESSDSGAFFTGKPFIGEIGYAFLMRSYRPEHGKWQTADPIGYPDGWNNLAYCNNGVTYCIDKFGTETEKLFDFDNLVYDCSVLEDRWTEDGDDPPFAYIVGTDYKVGLGRVKSFISVSAEKGGEDGFKNITPYFLSISGGSVTHIYPIRFDEYGYVIESEPRTYGATSLLDGKPEYQIVKKELVSGYFRYDLYATFNVLYKLSGDSWYNSISIPYQLHLYYEEWKKE